MSYFPVLMFFLEKGPKVLEGCSKMSSQKPQNSRHSRNSLRNSHLETAGATAAPNPISTRAEGQDCGSVHKILQMILGTTLYVLACIRLRSGWVYSQNAYNAQTFSSKSGKHPGHPGHPGQVRHPGHHGHPGHPGHPEPCGRRDTAISWPRDAASGPRRVLPPVSLRAF